MKDQKPQRDQRSKRFPGRPPKGVEPTDPKRRWKRDYEIPTGNEAEEGYFWLTVEKSIGNEETDVFLF